jgi:hypothetical protein
MSAGVGLWVVWSTHDSELRGIAPFGRHEWILPSNAMREAGGSLG